MKNYYCIFCLVVMVVFFGCGVKKSQVSFQFKHAKQKDVFVSVPLEDKFFWAANSRIQQLDTTLLVKVKKGTFFQFKNENNIIYLFLQPGDVVSCVYDYADKETPCRITGDNSEGQLLYNKLCQQFDIYKYARMRDFTKAPCDTVPEKMWQNFQTLMQEDIQPFEKLYREKKIDKGFLNYVKTDISYFYALALSVVIDKHFYAVANAHKTAYPGFKELWGKVYKTYPLTPKALVSPWVGDGFFGYVGLYVNYMRNLEQKNNEKDFTSQAAYDYADYVRLIKDPLILEYALAGRLYFLNLNNKQFDKNISDCLVKYREQFKGNPFSPFLEHYIEEVEDFQRKIKADYSDQIHFVEDFDKINSYEELLARFKGKAIFVDFWFSTCGPCKEQFEYGKELKAFLKENKIEMLYISVDGDAMDENWRNYIKYFNLEGHHVRTNKMLHTDLDKNYHVSLYPRYMIVNEEGKIVKPAALRPQEGEKLFRQIKEVLEK